MTPGAGSDEQTAGDDSVARGAFAPEGEGVAWGQLVGGVHLR
jgi:hypothetical protein